VKPAQFARNLAAAFANALEECSARELEKIRPHVGPALVARRSREADPELAEIWTKAMDTLGLGGSLSV
jgi:hypothetical protein